MSRARPAAVAAALSVALIAVGCSRSSSSSSSSSSGASSSQGAASSTPSAAGPGDFGTLKAVCGPGDAKGATGQGVTDTGITVGTMADPGAAASPGLDQELFDTAKGFEAWCNAAGGIAGRKLTVNLHDSKLFEVSARMVEACSTDFALVGNGEAFDASGVDQRVKCGLPEVPAYDNSPKATEAPLKVQATSLPIQQQTTAQYRGAKAMGLSKAGFIVGNLAGIIVTKNRLKEAAQKVGFTSVYDEVYPITGIDNPQAYVQRMKDAGVEVLQEVGDSSAMVALYKAMQTIGWYPKAIVLQANFYDPNLVKNGAGAVQNTWVLDGYFPFEEASTNKATQQYIDIMKQYVPGGKIAQLGLNAWDSWLLFATAARDCGATLTRDCLLQKAGAHPEWDGGGLKAAGSTDPVNRQMTRCYLNLKATPSGFQVDPTFLPPNKGPFNCDPANVVTLTGNYATQ